MTRVFCDCCGRSADSDSHSAEELCRAIGWSCEYGIVTCSLCQWRIGRTPEFVERIVGDAAPERSPLVGRIATAWRKLSR